MPVPGATILVHRSRLRKTARPEGATSVQPLRRPGRPKTEPASRRRPPPGSRHPLSGGGGVDHLGVVAAAHHPGLAARRSCLGLQVVHRHAAVAVARASEAGRLRLESAAEVAAAAGVEDRQVVAAAHDGGGGTADAVARRGRCGEAGGVRGLDSVGVRLTAMGPVRLTLWGLLLLTTVWGSFWVLRVRHKRLVAFIAFTRDSPGLEHFEVARARRF
jgi:hypothetical protein